MKKTKWKGYAKKIWGYGAQRYALFENGKRVGESSMTTDNTKIHERKLRMDGYRIHKGTVSEKY